MASCLHSLRDRKWPPLRRCCRLKAHRLTRRLEPPFWSERTVSRLQRRQRAEGVTGPRLFPIGRRQPCHLVQSSDHSCLLGGGAGAAWLPGRTARRMQGHQHPLIDITSDESDDSDGGLETAMPPDSSFQCAAVSGKHEACEAGDRLTDCKILNGVLQGQRADKTNLYNFSKMKKNRKWLKSILLTDDTTDSDTDSEDASFILSREELHDMLRLHRFMRQHQSKFYSERELYQYQYYSTGLLATHDPFYEQQRLPVGPKKKKIKDEKKFKAKLKKMKKKKKRGEGEFLDEDNPFMNKIFAKFSHDAPLPMVKKKHLTTEQLNARRRKLWLTVAKKEIPKSVKQKTSAKNLVLTNAKKLAHQCMREVRRAAIQAQKNCKETLPRARRLTKEMMLYWKKYDKVEKEHRKRAEKEALEQRKLDEEMREAKRQQRKLNFLITQTELYAHFMSGKANMGGQEVIRLRRKSCGSWKKMQHRDK
ncbi:hypothetical protein OJAV_G00233440 [Oryzias javanicus]|uniref:Chromatin-remodeling ATPase INO80 n=1 Tax=Oryzias javanicus TaxID=123683 RepID=A0A3S2PA46_ORYJA|nr:hypothetical protein OJAV_G00233440 [Oryzias javanicus]